MSVVCPSESGRAASDITLRTAGSDATQYIKAEGNFLVRFWEEVSVAVEREAHGRVPGPSCYLQVALHRLQSTVRQRCGADRGGAGASDLLSQRLDSRIVGAIRRNSQRSPFGCREYEGLGIWRA